MTLTWYFFRQFFPPFVFGSFLFLFVLLLDKLFDIVDLLFNKGVSLMVVGKLFLLFMPTVLPLTFPMAVLLACIVTFGRMSEENELTATRSAGVSLHRVLWLPPLFALILSLGMVPFNTVVTPWASRAFQAIYGRIVHAEPLINVEPRKFFSIRNTKIYAESVNMKSNQMTDLFVFQRDADNIPPQRIFAHRGTILATESLFTLVLENGQLQKFDPDRPSKNLNTTFAEYRVAIPINMDEKDNTTRFRNYSSTDLKKLIKDLRDKHLPVSILEAENSLRYAVAFAPVALVLVGIPLATVLKRGGRTFSFGVTIIVIFVYYLMLVLGLTLAEKGILPPNVALWIGNVICVCTGVYLLRRMLAQ
jgi:lipopolysaccharide export system permease protein